MSVDGVVRWVGVHGWVDGAGGEQRGAVPDRELGGSVHAGEGEEVRVADERVEAVDGGRSGVVRAAVPVGLPCERVRMRDPVHGGVGYAEVGCALGEHPGTTCDGGVAGQGGDAVDDVGDVGFGEFVFGGGAFVLPEDVLEREALPAADRGEVEGTGVRTERDAVGVVCVAGLPVSVFCDGDAVGGDGAGGVELRERTAEGRGVAAGRILCLQVHAGAEGGEHRGERVPERDVSAGDGYDGGGLDSGGGAGEEKAADADQVPVDHPSGHVDGADGEPGAGACVHRGCVECEHVQGERELVPGGAGAVPSPVRSVGLAGVADRPEELGDVRVVVVGKGGLVGDVEQGARGDQQPELGQLAGDSGGGEDADRELAAAGWGVVVGGLPGVRVGQQVLALRDGWGMQPAVHVRAHVDGDHRHQGFGCDAGSGCGDDGVGDVRQDFVGGEGRDRGDGGGGNEDRGNVRGGRVPLRRVFRAAERTGAGERGNEPGPGGDVEGRERVGFGFEEVRVPGPDVDEWGMRGDEVRAEDAVVGDAVGSAVDDAAEQAMLLLRVHVPHDLGSGT